MQEKNMSGERAAAADSGPKPFVARVERPDGSVRLIGVSDAARWLGCSTVALGLAAREMPGRGRKLADRARVEFPGLFREQAGGLAENGQAR
jgi:hypothetical protein